MTDYEKLANWCVSEGAVKKWDDFGVFRYRIGNSDLLTDKEVCHDWRVVGAMMELANELDMRLVQFDDFSIGVMDSDYNEWFADTNLSLPLAILTAIYRAMEDQEKAEFEARLEMNCEGNE